MLATQIIAHKRDGHSLSDDAIRFMITGMLDGSVPDYQISAWAMAILCRGMNAAETACLTQCMLESGSRLSRASEQPRVDKHSTGGLGDKVSLVLAPLVACFELDVPMLSGRGLGITGGTLDKLESYPGFRCDLSQAEIERQLRHVGCVITGTTPEIAPADRKLYALRDVSGTVPSVPLITSSILSKKLAESLDALVLDVKFGSGAFMRSWDAAAELSQSLQATSQFMNLNARIVMSDMHQPLGRTVGNACEVNEAVRILQGEGPTDVLQLTLHLSAELLISVGRAASARVAESLLLEALNSGRAYERYRAMLEAQGASFQEHLPLESPRMIESPQAGWIRSIDGQKLGHAVILLGGGRRLLGEQLNHSVGFEMLVRIGERVGRGQPLVRVFVDDASRFEKASHMILQAIEYSENPVPKLPLIPHPPDP